MHVMFVALSVEVTVNFNVAMRMLFGNFCVGVITTPGSPFCICCPLDFQIKPLAAAVQLNSATSLIEILTDLGGMVISALIVQVIQ